MVKNKFLKKEKALFVFSVVIIFLALVNLGITLYKIGGFDKITGHATDLGTANLTITSQASINFTTESINWGIGSVNENAILAHLVTNGTVTNGNWTPVSQGLTIRNDGNCFVKLNLTTSNNATDFIGGTSPEYNLAVSDNESSSCISGLASSFTAATAEMQPGCWNLSFADASDSLDIDVQLMIPPDALPGSKGSFITATATVI